jgi:hypothetical protein
MHIPVARDGWAIARTSRSMARLLQTQGERGMVCGPAALNDHQPHESQ